MPYTLSDLKAGDHVLHIYNTETEYYTILVSYIQQGLERGEKVVYAASAASPEAILAALKASGMDPAPYLSKGQLVILPGEAVYLSEDRFVPERLFQTIQALLKGCGAEGYTGARLGGEMSWVLQHKPGTERLLEYEAALNRMLGKKSCTLLCQYQRQRFPADVLLDMLRCHPVVIVGEHLSTNFYYVPHAETRHAHMGAGRLRAWLETLHENGAIQEPNLGFSPHLALRLRQRQQAQKTVQRVWGVWPTEESDPQLYL